MFFTVEDMGDQMRVSEIWDVLEWRVGGVLRNLNKVQKAVNNILQSLFAF